MQQLTVKKLLTILAKAIEKDPACANKLVVTGDDTE